jgi:hypothetical protein
MFKRISTILFFFLPFSLTMADSITGMCGDSLYWFFDTETHHLDITGKGKMNLNKYSAWTTKDITIHSISFSDSITSIDSYAFEEQALTEVIIPASVKKFGNRAFANNMSLLHFEYNGDGYCETGDMILYNCKNLRYFKGATRMLAYNDALDTVIVTYGYALTNFYERTYIDNTLAYDTRLSGKYDERPKKIKTFFFPNQIEVIGNYLLCNAVELKGIVIPEQTKTIGKASFLNCSSLDSLVFMGNGIESIGDSAFCNCSQLVKISLQDTLPPIIEAHTFEGVDRSIPIHVPLGSSKRYKEAPYWSEFYNFIEPSTATYVDEVQVQHNAAKKLIFDGQLLIIKDNIIHNIMGQKLSNRHPSIPTLNTKQ